MERNDYYCMLKSKYQDINVFSALEKTFRKISEYFNTHDHICISVSGGSDSDCIVHLVCTYFPEYLDKCNFVFVNTGLEYDATKRHLCDLEKRYGITIDKIRGKSVVTVIKQYGIPILNKAKAKAISMYQRRTPKGYYLVFEADGSYYKFTERERELAKYCDLNGIRISQKCCDISKKKPLHAYSKEHDIDLDVTGERKAEGGVRATSNKSCFRENDDSADRFMPLFWWTDAVKATFKKIEGIRYSDCYEVYGLRRTGCVGCPFGQDTAHELEVMYQFEPQLFKACMNVFGQAYKLTDKFNCRRKKCLPEYFQMSLF